MAEANHTSAPSEDHLTEAEMAGRLRLAGLRPTKQRLSLALMMFGSGHRHLTAETLYQETKTRGLGISLSTVYNTLHQFAEAGLLREISFERMPSYFDTNTEGHVHFIVEGTQEVIDGPPSLLSTDHLPTPPPGFEIVNASVVIRLRPVAN